MIESAIILEPWEVAIVMAIRQQIDAYRVRPDYWVARIDADPHRVVCSFERKAKTTIEAVPEHRVCATVVQ